MSGYLTKRGGREVPQKYGPTGAISTTTDTNAKDTRKKYLTLDGIEPVCFVRQSDTFPT